MVVAQAQVRPVPATMRLVATVEPVVRSVIGAEVEGLVVDMPVRQGDQVEQGMVICQLNNDIMLAELEAARAKLRTLQARLDELEAGTRAEELAWLKAAYEEAKALHEKWGLEKQRVEALEARGTTFGKEVYETEAEFQAAQQRMLAAQARYEEGVAGPRPEVIAQARHAVAEQKAVAERAERNVAKTTIHAPFSGSVVKRHSEAGEWVQRGGSIVELIDLSRVLVTVDTPERAFRYVRTGDQARVMVDSVGAEFVGRIKHVIPQADLVARTFPVQIEIDNHDGPLKGGMIAWATLISGPASEVVAVPKDAVNVRHGTPTVCVITPGEQGPMATPVSVTTGADIEDWIAITSGNVAPDAQVVVRGNERIDFPTPVLITNAASAAPAAEGGAHATAAGSPNEPHAEAQKP